MADESKAGDSPYAGAPNLEDQLVPDPDELLGGRTKGEDDPPHPGLIKHILMQLRPGQDLTRVTIPSFYLEDRSLLEKLTDTMMHPELMLACVGDELQVVVPCQRCLRPCFLTRPFLCAHPNLAACPSWKTQRAACSKWRSGTCPGGTTRRSYVGTACLLLVACCLGLTFSCLGTCAHQGVKKPYNPIIGETFACQWRHASGSTSCYFAEQVSHRPPVSAMYFENRKEHIVINAQVWTKSKFKAPQTAVSILAGGADVHILNHNEMVRGVGHVWVLDCVLCGVLWCLQYSCLRVIMYASSAVPCYYAHLLRPRLVVRHIADGDW